MKKVNAEGKGWFIVICALCVCHCRSESAFVCACVAMVKHSAGTIHIT